MSEFKLTHLNEAGESRMVDVGDKRVSAREAMAEGFISMPPELVRELKNLKKGNAFEVARIAGIMAAKKTEDLIPLCHQIQLDKVQLKFEPDADAGRVRVVSQVKCHGRTGVEMEALTAVTTALLTLYDMGKAAARDMIIDGVRLLRKSGGKSGDYVAENVS